MKGRVPSSPTVHLLHTADGRGVKKAKTWELHSLKANRLQHGLPRCMNLKYTHVEPTYVRST